MTPRITLAFAALLAGTSLAFALPRDHAGKIWEVRSDQAWNGFAHQVLALPDLDADGVADLAVSVFGERRVELRSGRSGALIGEFRGPESFGMQLALTAAPDGAPRLLVAAPLADAAELDSGRVSLHALPSGQLLWSRWGAHAEARLGLSLTLSHDGGDVLAATHRGPCVRLALEGGATLEVVSARAANDRPLMDSRAPLAVVPHVGDDDDGRVLARPGDVDGDGVDDLLLGIPGDDEFATDAGAVHLLSGRTGAELAVLHGETREARFGSVVGSLGDFDGDGRVEIFVGGYVIDEYAAPRAFLSVLSLPRLALSAGGESF